ncbi:hypothetical protein HZH68_011365 [Vespula germanica]|uniref:Uncharacterized protein n=1 Tax=Vespula germanica TaxID=30212 RepID=A0A834JPD4_VESGE|nr:hypothetical protein HZH68_011365 [Vespula germanica]
MMIKEVAREFAPNPGFVTGSHDDQRGGTRNRACSWCVNTSRPTSRFRVTQRLTTQGCLTTLRLRLSTDKREERGQEQWP